MPLTWQQIYRYTEDKRREKAQTTVKVTSLKLGLSKGKKKPVAAAKVFSVDMYGGKRSTNRYVTKILWLDEKNVFISCSCPDFTFSGAEYRLTKKGSSTILYGNGDPPEDRPTVILACKHLLCLYDYLEDRDLIRPVVKYFKKNPQARSSRP